MTAEEAVLSSTDLEAQRAVLVDQLKEIDLQLSEKNRRAPNGERMDDHAYQAWRGSALRAKRVKEKHLAAIKKQLRERDAERGALPDKDRALIQDAFGIIRSAVYAGYVPTEIEQAVIDALARVAQPVHSEQAAV